GGRPFQATLVPERRREITTEGGLAVRRTDRRLGDTIRRLSDAGLRVSLFIGPDLKTIDAAAAIGVPAIELHTGRYAHTWRKSGRALDELRRAAEIGRASCREREQNARSGGYQRKRINTTEERAKTIDRKH